MGERIDAAATLAGDQPAPDGPAVPLAAELIGFVDAVTGSDRAAADTARAALADAGGPAALVDAAGVLANFEMMTRVADGTGAKQLPDRLAILAAERERLGLDSLTSAR